MPPKFDKKNKKNKFKSKGHFRGGPEDVPTEENDGKDAIRFRMRKAERDAKDDSENSSGPDEQGEGGLNQNTKKSTKKDGGESSSSDEEEEGQKRSYFGKKQDVHGKMLKKLAKEAEESEEEGEIAPLGMDQDSNRYSNRELGLNPTDRQMGEQGLTRRQREDLDKERKKKHWEKLHAAGETDEARADLQRLAKIRAEREAKSKEKADKLKADEEQKKVSRGGDRASSAFTAALGGEESRRLTKKSKKKKDKSKDQSSDEEDTKTGKKKDDHESTLRHGNSDTYTSKMAMEASQGLYSDYSDKRAIDFQPSDNVAVGTIEACREAEEDFM